MKKRLIIVILATLAVTFVFPILSPAMPARDGLMSFSQPDGTTFKAKLHGDAFCRIMTLEDGCAVLRDSDGWYCYAYFDELGRRSSSGVRVGEHVPTSVAAASRNIPYRLMAARAAAKRADAKGNDGSGRFHTSMPESPRTKAEAETKHALVILAQFTDLQMTYGKDKFEKLLNEKGYSYHGAKGSAIDYFNDQFAGLYDFSFFVSEVVTLPYGHSYYGTNDSDGTDENAPLMIRDACIAADQEIDFSIYDDDKDGKVDNVFVFFAGKDEADGGGEECIWSHAWDFASAGIRLKLDGVNIGSYACTSELRYNSITRKWDFAGIGTFCHEYTHTFGIADMYDTDYENQDQYYSAGLWFFTSLMDGGGYNGNGNCPPGYNAVEREFFGIGTCETLAPGEYTLEPIDKGNRYLKMETGNKDEYYLFECRKASGWDSYIGGDGLLIYHVDKSLNDSGRSQVYDEYFNGRKYSAADRWYYNEVNANPEHQCVDLIEADGRSDKITTTSWNIGGIFFPTTKSTSYSPITNPAFTFWNGGESSLAIYGITRSDDGNVSFTVREYDNILPPNPAEIKCDIFQDAAIISWAADYTKEGTAHLRWCPSSSNAMKEANVSYEGGRWSVTLEGIEPRTAYRCEIWFELNGLESSMESVNFTTKSRSDGFEYIHLKYVDRNDDGSFPEGVGLPLRVFNAIDAEGVKWFWDGKEISTCGDGYFHPISSGTLRAVVFCKDGETVTIEKKIVVKTE